MRPVPCTRCREPTPPLLTLFSCSSPCPSLLLSLLLLSTMNDGNTNIDPGKNAIPIPQPPQAPIASTTATATHNSPIPIPSLYQSLSNRIHSRFVRYLDIGHLGRFRPGSGRGRCHCTLKMRTVLCCRRVSKRRGQMAKYRLDNGSNVNDEF